MVDEQQGAVAGGGSRNELPGEASSGPADRPDAPYDDARTHADGADDTTITTALAVPDEPEDNPGHSDARRAAFALDNPRQPEAERPEFPVVLRGYDRHRVDATLADLRGSLDAATARYETAEAALTAARTAAAEAQREAEQQRRAAEEARDTLAGRIAPAALSERIRRILELAEEEAAELRATAERDAEQAVAGARAEVERLTRRRAELDDELGRLHAKIAALLGGGPAGTAADR